jgi:hypothetical protein
MLEVFSIMTTIYIAKMQKLCQLEKEKERKQIVAFFFSFFLFFFFDMPTQGKGGRFELITPAL